MRTRMTSVGSVQKLLRWLKLLFVFFVLSIIIFILLTSRTQPTTDDDFILLTHTNTESKVEISESSRLTSGDRILIVFQAKAAETLILKHLQHLRIEYETCIVNQDCEIGQYSLIIFTEGTYSDMSNQFLVSLTFHCRSHCTYFVITHESRISQTFLFNSLHNPRSITFHTLSNPIYFLTKHDLTYSDNTFSESISCFSSFHPTFRPLLISDFSSGPKNCWTIIQDFGEIDLIPKIYFGISPLYWLANLIFLDVLRYFAKTTRFSDYPLERYLMVDMDDVFLGAKGLKLEVRDVERLLKSQFEINKIIPGFKYNLGYCGAYYQSGNADVQRGDEFLVEKSSEFSWFGHIWSHIKIHKSSESSLIELMRRDIEFSLKHNLSIESLHYSVTPHHSGIYPIHTPLYNAWRELGHVSVTSTEQYPMLWPHHLRRGFVYNSVSVLPRQVCGLYTKINFYADFAGGKSAFYQSIRGGSVFKTLVYNPVSIFMTHFPNYAGDHLAQSLFEELTRFVHDHTRIRLKYRKPVELAEIYFKLFPDDVLPVWNLPCNTLQNSRHAEIYAGNISCDRTPRILIVGPQKTGSTALLSFLVALPLFASSRRDPETFEEVQFFSNLTRYLYGPDWYQDRFPSPLDRTLVEKSATYFDHDLAPKRIQSLLPNSLIIVILRDPIERAFSWYQHQKAHANTIALKYSFIEVLRNETNIWDAKESKLISNLKKRCLEPGKYALHISAWLEHFKLENLLFIDGSQIVQNPSEVITDIIKFAGTSPNILDISKYLHFDTSKGFYCPLDSNNQVKCLGPGKGREYEPMQPEEFNYLRDFYAHYNKQLKELFVEYNRTLPTWL